MRKKRIFKKSFAIKLMQMGCSLVKVEQNKHNKNLQVYSFEDNETLRKALDTLMN